MVGKYPVITLCGSTRFKDQFLEAQKRLTLEGNIVISVGLFGHSGDDEVWTEGTKEMLDDMHKRKIDMADAIYVINVGGYIGESTRSEIEYAKRNGKEVRYLDGSTSGVPEETVREIAEMLDCGHVCYLNPDTNETVFIPNPASWEYFEEPDMVTKELEKVDSWERRIKLTPPESFESFQFMESFIDELPENESILRNKLISALSHSHPFARFKAAIDNCPYRQKWFDHKQRCLEKYVRDEISTL
ncbi:MAG: hypothetical protein ACI3YY_05730 [Candidatus Cryptobacteroides sp.]